VLAVFAGIIFINWGNGDSNDTTFQSFSGRIFGALLVGVIEAFAVSLLLTTKIKPCRLDKYLTGILN
jgi:hypothetical protein